MPLDTQYRSCASPYQGLHYQTWSISQLRQSTPWQSLDFSLSFHFKWEEGHRPARLDGRWICLCCLFCVVPDSYWSLKLILLDYWIANISGCWQRLFPLIRAGSEASSQVVIQPNVRVDIVSLKKQIKIKTKMNREYCSFFFSTTWHNIGDWCDVVSRLFAAVNGWTFWNTDECILISCCERPNKKNCGL